MTKTLCPRCRGEYYTVSPQCEHICPYCGYAPAETMKEFYEMKASVKKEKEFRRKLDLWNRITYYLMPQGIFGRKK